jgi:uncharacterized protein YndB with AHSA1/START domain
MSGGSRRSGVRTYSAIARAPAERVWPLLAEPDLWPQWAPHLRGAWALGDPEVRRGARGAARLLGLVPVPAAIVAKEAGRMWAWRVGPVVMVHRVTPRAGGSCIVIELRAPEPLETAVAATYGRLIELLLRNLARRAERRR